MDMDLFQSVKKVKCGMILIGYIKSDNGEFLPARYEKSTSRVFYDLEDNNFFYLGKLISILESDEGIIIPLVSRINEIRQNNNTSITAQLEDLI